MCSDSHLRNPCGSLRHQSGPARLTSSGKDKRQEGDRSQIRSQGRGDNHRNRSAVTHCFIFSETSRASKQFDANGEQKGWGVHLKSQRMRNARLEGQPTVTSRCVDIFRRALGKKLNWKYWKMKNKRGLFFSPDRSTRLTSHGIIKKGSW